MSEVLLEKREHTAIITFNRPASLNALCETFMREIDAALDQVEQDPDIYTLIFTGSGRAFIAGADIKEMYEKNKDAIFSWSALGSNLNLRIENLRIPVIAAINGFALGAA